MKKSQVIQKERKKLTQPVNKYDDIFDDEKPESKPNQKPKTNIKIVIHNKTQISEPQPQPEQSNPSPQPQPQQQPQQQQFVTKRSWYKNLDNLINPDEMKEGKFSEDEVEQIMGVVHNYQAENNLSDEQLQDYIELKTLGLSKIWLTITKYIPTRTVDSVYKLIRRKFDSKNRSGYWSKQEVEELLKHVQHYGRKWREISRLMHRTPDNIRNKYINLGQHNFLFRDKSFWTIAEVIILMEQIQLLSGYQLLKSGYEETLALRVGPDFAQTKFRLNYRKMQPHDKMIFETLQEIVSLPNDLGVVVKWTEIATEIKTKTKDDVRQMWFKLQGLPY